MALAEALAKPLSPGASQMKRIYLNRYALSIAAVALLAACGGSQPPIDAPGARVAPFAR